MISISKKYICYCIEVNKKENEDKNLIFYFYPFYKIEMRKST
jgi:hypothetical protein